MRKIIPDELEEIPETYLNPSRHPGEIEVFEYNTYDAFHYGQDGRQIHKKALIYLPYGYDDTQKYDIFYLMHGGWGNEKTYLGNHRAFPKSNGNSYGYKYIVDNQYSLSIQSLIPRNIHLYSVIKGFRQKRAFCREWHGRIRGKGKS